MGGRCIKHKWVGIKCDWCGQTRIKRYAPCIQNDPYYDSSYPEMEEDPWGEYVKLKDVEEMLTGE